MTPTLLVIHATDGDYLLAFECADDALVAAWGYADHGYDTTQHALAGWYPAGERPGVVSPRQLSLFEE